MSRLRGNDASESIGLNRRIVNVEAWTAGMGIDIVDRTRDTDVSGDTDPFARRDLLGTGLTTEPMNSMSC